MYSVHIHGRQNRKSNKIKKTTQKCLDMLHSSGTSLHICVMSHQTMICSLYTKPSEFQVYRSIKQ